MRRLWVELRRRRAGQTADAARELDDRELHAKADPEERDLFLAGVADGGDLAFGAARAEARRHQDPVDVAEEGLGSALLDLLAVDVADEHPAVVGDAAVDQRLVQRLVALHELDVLADEADAHAAR